MRVDGEHLGRAAEVGERVVDHRDVDRAHRAQVLGDDEVGVEAGTARPRRGGRGPRPRRIASATNASISAGVSPSGIALVDTIVRRARLGGVVALEGHADDVVAGPEVEQDLRRGRAAARRCACRPAYERRRRVVAVDDPSLWTLALLALAGLFAGFVDAVVGGGGLVQLPALVVAFPGAAPVQVLATNKLAGTCGTSVSSLTYYRRVRPDPRTFVPLMAVAFVGSAVGAVAASHLPRSAFDPIILVALVVVGALRAAQARTSARRPSCGSPGTGTRWPRWLAGLVIGFYDGALGPGTGSFFVFTLVGPARLQLPRGLRQGPDRQLGDERRGPAGVRGAGGGDVAGRPGGRRVQPPRQLRRGPHRGVAGAAGSSGCSSSGGRGVHREDRLRRRPGPVVTASSSRSATARR